MSDRGRMGTYHLIIRHLFCSWKRDFSTSSGSCSAANRYSVTSQARKPEARTECARREVVERLSNVLDEVSVHTAKILPRVLRATSVEPEQIVVRAGRIPNNTSDPLKHCDVSAMARLGTAEQNSPD